MKLIMCPACKDVFKLRSALRECDCGLVQGRYVDASIAEVSKGAISIAIGNGSLQQAISNMNRIKSSGDADRNSYRDEARIEYAWVRPNSGKGNPHTKVLGE